MGRRPTEANAPMEVQHHSHHPPPPPHHCRHNYNHNHDYAADLHRTMEQVKGDQARSQVINYCPACGDCDAGGD